MSTQLFQGQEHATIYQKHRFPPSQELLDIIFSYLEEKKGKPYDLVVDVGCGSGQSTQVLVPHFARVLGTDISEAQVQQARQAHSSSKVSFCLVLQLQLPPKPQACPEAHHPLLRPLPFPSYCSPWAAREAQAHRLLEEATNPFCDTSGGPASRIILQGSEVPFTVAGLMGFLQSFSMFQTFKKAQPEAAAALLHQTQARFLETMKASSPETPLALSLEYVCVLACKAPEENVSK
ncbi:uncharacterized protein LOC100924767 [Sarcophilus harrisii]|uniref:uncharacterized protein LOC100924767 n=1 Tax=Sarcophilus harrisii TaxID=9305 RepID=UPI001301F2D2|nr:uncharacterized protein LOC100924767 [Sarcophilus harrisii]